MICNEASQSLQYVEDPQCLPGRLLFNLPVWLLSESLILEHAHVDLPSLVCDPVSISTGLNHKDGAENFSRFGNEGDVVRTPCR